MANRELTVKVGSYQKDGQTKHLYKKCGEEVVKKDGGKFYKVYSWFNFAGCIKEEDGSVLMNVQDAYDPEKKNAVAPTTTQSVASEEIPF